MPGVLCPYCTLPKYKVIYHDDFEKYCPKIRLMLAKEKYYNAMTEEIRKGAFTVRLKSIERGGGG